MLQSVPRSRQRPAQVPKLVLGGCAGPALRSATHAVRDENYVVTPRKEAVAGFSARAMRDYEDPPATPTLLVDGASRPALSGHGSSKPCADAAVVDSKGNGDADVRNGSPRPPRSPSPSPPPSARGTTASYRDRLYKHRLLSLSHTSSTREKSSGRPRGGAELVIGKPKPRPSSAAPPKVVTKLRQLRKQTHRGPFPQRESRERFETSIRVLYAEYEKAGELDPAHLPEMLRRLFRVAEVGPEVLVDFKRSLFEHLGATVAYLTDEGVFHALCTFILEHQPQSVAKVALSAAPVLPRGSGGPTLPDGSPNKHDVVHHESLARRSILSPKLTKAMLRDEEGEAENLPEEGPEARPGALDEQDAGAERALESTTFSSRKSRRKSCRKSVVAGRRSVKMSSCNLEAGDECLSSQRTGELSEITKSEITLRALWQKYVGRRAASSSGCSTATTPRIQPLVRPVPTSTPRILASGRTTPRGTGGPVCSTTPRNFVVPMAVVPSMLRELGVADLLQDEYDHYLAVFWEGWHGTAYGEGENPELHDKTCMDFHQFKAALNCIALAQEHQ